MAALQAAKKYATLPPTVRTLASGVPHAPSLNLSARTPDAHHGHAGRTDVPPKWAGGYQLSSNGLINKSFTTGTSPHLSKQTLPPPLFSPCLNLKTPLTPTSKPALRLNNLAQIKKTSYSLGIKRRLPAAAYHARISAAARRARSARPKRIPSVLARGEPRAVVLRDRVDGRALRVRGQVVRGGVPRHDVRVGGRARAGEGGGRAGEHPGGQERDHQVARQARVHTPPHAGRDRRGAPRRLEGPARSAVGRRSRQETRVARHARRVHPLGLRAHRRVGRFRRMVRYLFSYAFERRPCPPPSPRHALPALIRSPFLVLT
jgi:hypothetical protein